MKSYPYDNIPGDQRLPHEPAASTPLSPAYLSTLGVHYHLITDAADLEALAARRGYKNRDEVTVSPDAMGAVYEDKVRMFFNEHMHEDEEIRYIVDGSGFFDVRDQADQWVRIWLEKDDLIVLPAGVYHRFTTDEKNYIKAMRLFKDEPKWTPLNRGAETDGSVHRKQYLEERARLQLQAA